MIDILYTQMKLIDIVFENPVPPTQLAIDDRSKQLLELINQSPELAELLIKTLSGKQAN